MEMGCISTQNSEVALVLLSERAWITQGQVWYSYFYKFQISTRCRDLGITNRQPICRVLDLFILQSSLRIQALNLGKAIEKSLNPEAVFYLFYSHVISYSWTWKL